MDQRKLIDRKNTEEKGKEEPSGGRGKPKLTFLVIKRENRLVEYHESGGRNRFMQLLTLSQTRGGLGKE